LASFSALLVESSGLQKSSLKCVEWDVTPLITHSFTHYNANVIIAMLVAAAYMTLSLRRTDINRQTTTQDNSSTMRVRLRCVMRHVFVDDRTNAAAAAADII